MASDKIRLKAFPAFFIWRHPTLKFHHTIAFLLTLFFTPLFSEVIQREGDGFLEQDQGQLVLHVKGTPYDRGFQHGKLLKKLIESNITTFIETPKPGFNERLSAFVENLPLLLSYVPRSFQDEMRGLADSASSALSDVGLHSDKPSG